MLLVLALAIAEKTSNAIIDLDCITREQLNDLQGQSLRVVLQSPKIAVDVFFDEQKVRLEPATAYHSSTNVNATLSVANIVELFKLLLSHHDEVGNIPVQGDYHLLMRLQSIMQQTQIDLANALTPVFGATIAHEIGRLQQVPQYVWQQCQNQAYVWSDILKEDSGLFAPRWQMDKVQQEHRQLKQEIERLEARIAQLKQQIKQKTEE